MVSGLVELRIKQARRDGAFDGLPGAGKPLDLHDLAGLDHEHRVEALLMRSLGEVPEEVKLLKQLDVLSSERQETTNARRRAALAEQMEKKAIRLSVLLERGGRNLSAHAILERFRPEDLAVGGTRSW